MTPNDAKLILQSYRPGDQDAGDPYFVEALALAKTDVELAAWFAEQKKFDANVSNGLQQVRVPSRLKAEILALQKPAASPLTTWWQNLFPWQSPVFWAKAAVAMLIMGLAAFYLRPEPADRFADYSTQMVRAAINDTHHADAPASDMKQALAWLATHRGENNLVLPTTLNDGKGLMGCRVLDWHGQKVSMLCYMVNGSAHVDVFVAEANIFPDAPPVDQPQFARNDGMATASWTHAGKTYLAISHADETILKKMLSPETAAQWKRRLFCQKSNF